MAIKKKLTKAGPRYYVETRSNGAKVHHPGGYATRREAEAALSRLKVAKLDGVYLAPQTQTVGAYLDSWLASHKGVRPRTRARYEQAIRDHVIPVIGAVRLDALRIEDCQRVVDTAEASGLQPGPVIKVASILRAALALAVKRGTVTRNLATAEHGLQLPTEAKSKLTPPTPAEVTRILDAASDPYRLPLTLAAWCGLRRSEILALRWRDVDLEAGELRVRQSLSFVGRELSFSEPKTERSLRTVPLSPALVSLLQETRREQAARRLRVGPEWRDHDLVISGVDGSPWHPDRLSLYFTRLVGRLGMTCRLHDLRHCFVSTLLAQGVPVLDVSRIAGHASGGFTMDRYGHLQPDHGDGIRDAMARAYARSAP